jgi:hypothetical protein
MNGWTKRFGVNVVDTETRSFFSQFFFPAILNQDPRYFPKREGNVFERGWYAATRVLVVRADSGQSTFNSSYLLSVAFTRALSTAYIPENQQNFRDTMLSIVGAYGSDAGSYVLQEFWPDIMRVFRRHAPEPVVKIEQKLPPELIGAPKDAQGKNCTGSDCNCSADGQDANCAQQKSGGSGHSPSRKEDCAPRGQCRR